jgi:hypothetical protein
MVKKMKSRNMRGRCRFMTGMKGRRRNPDSQKPCDAHAKRQERALAIQIRKELARANKIRNKTRNQNTAQKREKR